MRGLLEAGTVVQLVGRILAGEGTVRPAVDIAEPQLDTVPVDTVLSFEDIQVDYNLELHVEGNS